MRRLLRHRGILSAIVVIICAAFGGGAWWLLAGGGPPNPATASFSALARYLVIGDIAEQPYSYRVAMVDRLLKELEQNEQASRSTAEIPAALEDRFAENLRALKRAWFYSRSERYHGLPPAEQSAYMDQRIEEVLLWSQFDLGLEESLSEQERQARQSAYAAEFFTQLETWMAEAEPSRQAILEQAVRAGVVRWLATQSLTEQPPGVRRELARRVVADLNRGLELKRVLSELPPGEQQQLAANGLLLVEAWLHDQARQYAALDREAKKQFLNTRVEQVSDWNLQALLQSQSGGALGESEGSSLSGSLALMSQVNRWIERAEPEQQKKLQSLVFDLQRLLLSRAFEEPRS